MPAITSYDNGEFCWTNMGAPDVDAAKKFYSAIFGWTYKEIPSAAGGISLCQVEGHTVCGIYSMEEDMRRMKIPPYWMPYVSIESADSGVAKAKAAGAKVLHEPSDIEDAGRFAILQDPTGAIFALWQGKRHPGATIGGVPGTVCWRELTTTNLDISAKFYSTNFGWSGTARDMGHMTYHMLALGDEGVAGMMLPPRKDIPSHWLTYWIVKNSETTSAQAKKLGAQLLVPSTAIPGMGRFAILLDPQGAAFGIFEALES